MNQGKTVLSQLMSFLPEYEFNKCVDAYNGNGLWLIHLQIDCYAKN
ncbi:MAG: DUF4372 domain-containing protein [Bacteroidota bacterium]